MKKYYPIQYVEPDDLPVMEVGNWAQKKYKLVGKYCDIFTSGMKYKWNLIYIDLFSGPGFVKIKQTKNLIKNSALLAMNVPNQFDHYILNDYSKENADAIEIRAKRLHPDISLRVYNKDANNCIKQILNERPVFTNGKPTLTFCFLDPFSLNLNFNTIKELANEQVDILVLHALQMDGRRNLKYYLEENHNRISLFTGNPNWRIELQQNDIGKNGLVKFLSDNFDGSIKSLGYLSSDRKELIQNTSGAGIYYLAFYSKHERGIEFFEKIRKGPTDQLEMF